MSDLGTLIRNFKKQFAHEKKENIMGFRDGKVVSHVVGSKGSTSFGGDIKDVDVIHNHPSNSPALSEMDLIMTIYGNAIPLFTSGMRAIKGSVHAGAATSIIQSGCCSFKILNRLCASTISPTQAGPSTRIFSGFNATANSNTI